MSDAAGHPLDPAGLRGLVVEHCGFDPGALAPASRLDDVGIHGFGRLSLVAAIESVHGVEFPADLLTALETVDDLVHYTNLKAGQRT